MTPKILVSKDLNKRILEIEKDLADFLKVDEVRKHPDLLYLDAETKLGVEQARIIKDHFSFKPLKASGRALVLEDGGKLTVEAQNALLKTFEEESEVSLILIGVDSELSLLPTVLSRCQVIYIKEGGEELEGLGGLEGLVNSTLEERFEYVEATKDKEELLQKLIIYFRGKLIKEPTPKLEKFVKELLVADKWAKQNVNTRAILEYLMMIMP